MIENPERELRMLPGTVELRAAAEGDSGGGTIVGYAAVFDTDTDMGWFIERVARGAFTETIKKDDIRALVDHDPVRILGRKKAGTLRLKEDSKGLRMEIDIPSTTAGADITESINRGDVDGASFAFRTIDDRWETKDGKEHRTLLKAKVQDVGPVTFPAYPQATIGLRDAGISALVGLRKKQLEAAAPEPQTLNARQMAERRQRHAEALSR